MLFCTICESITQTACGVCYLPYCNIECQIIDWQIHKKSCRPKNPSDREAAEESLFKREPERPLQKSFELSSDEEIKEKEYSVVSLSRDALPVAPFNKIFTKHDLEVIDLREGENVRVIVVDTTFLESGFISVMSNEKQYRYELNENLTTLVKNCNKYQTKMRGYTPKLDEMCLALYDYEKQWYRAVCLKKLANQVLLQFVDFGNVAIVPSKNIMPINDDMMFPVCTHFVRLTNIDDDYLEKFRQFVNQRPKIEGQICFNGGVYSMNVVNVEQFFNKHTNRVVSLFEFKSCK